MLVDLFDAVVLPPVPRTAHRPLRAVGLPLGDAVVVSEACAGVAPGVEKRSVTGHHGNHQQVERVSNADVVEGADRTVPGQLLDCSPVAHDGRRGAAEDLGGVFDHLFPLQIIEVEAERAPIALKDAAELIITEQRHRSQEEGPPACIEKIREDVRDQPPHLPVQNGRPAEAEIAVDHVAGVNEREHIDGQIADGNDEHEIRNALAPVFEAEAFKPSAKILHSVHPPDVQVSSYRLRAGKSTLLEAMMSKYEERDEEEPGMLYDGTEAYKIYANVLPEHIKLIETRKPEKHFFFRAESFFNHAAELDRQAQLELRKYSKIYAYKAYGGRSLLEQSHGESFLSAFLNYASRNTLFILDEPEAALSPQRQLALLVRIHELVNNGCQLIISTHSPILMAYPNADIYAIDDTGAHITPYEETEHYQLTKYFLTHTEQMMKELLG